LDSHTGIEVLALIKKLNEEGNTIILVTHDNNIAAQAKRIVRISDGKIIEDTKNENIKNESAKDKTTEDKTTKDEKNKDN